MICSVNISEECQAQDKKFVLCRNIQFIISLLTPNEINTLKRFKISVLFDRTRLFDVFTFPVSQLVLVSPVTTCSGNTDEEHNKVQ